MDIPTIILLIIALVAISVDIAINGWKNYFKKLVFITLFLGLYFTVIKLFGQTGKEVFAGAGVIFACIFLYYRKKRGESLWW